MAYYKHKELTKYFYFYKQLDVNTLPKYVMDYIEDKEKILYAFATSRDIGIFTNEKIVLFDIRGIINYKQIYTLPYKSISTVAILFKNTTAELLMYLDSSYPVNLKFVDLTADDKINLRKIYNYICGKIV